MTVQTHCLTPITTEFYGIAVLADSQSLLSAKIFLKTFQLEKKIVENKNNIDNKNSTKNKTLVSILINYLNFISP